jgi:hypothetical protein
LKKNIDRNARLYELWKNWHTIDEASKITRIPRSTVGYYFRKFRKHEKRGNVSGSINLRRKAYSEKEQIEKLESYFSKLELRDMARKIKERVEFNGDYKNAYYGLKFYEKYLEIKNSYALTDEELQLLNDTSKTENVHKTTKKGKSLEEILELAKKKT